MIYKNKVLKEQSVYLILAKIWQKNRGKEKARIECVEPRNK